MCRRTQKLIARGDEIGVALTLAGLQVKVETRDVAQFDDRRGYNREDLCVADLAEGPEGTPGKRLYALLRLFPIVPVFKLDEGDAHVLPAPAEAEPDTNVNDPLTPDAPASDVATMMSPLDDELP